MKLALQVPALNHVRRGARARTPAVALRLVDRLAPALVMAALLFNFALCFLKTRGLPIGQVSVIASEVAIIAIAGLAVAKDVSRPTIAFFLILPAYIGFLRYYNYYLDLKIAIDMAIPVIFWVLGEKYASREGADRIVLLATSIMIAVGLFEWFAVDEYQKYFDIFQYYVDKGSADPSQATFSGTKLFVSGIRPAGEGRELIKGLGNHRVSSIILEPVGAGNLGAIIFLWGLERLFEKRNLSLFLMVAAALIIILADTRMGAVLCVIGLIARMLPLMRTRLFLFAIPIIVPVLILVVSGATPDGRIDNGFMGRIYSSGHLMSSWGPLQWMGLQISPITPYDSGYGYLFSNFGVAACVLMWAMATRRMGLGSTGGFGVTTMLYCALGMCVSGSTFSIKTAALLWFLNGVLSAQQVNATPPFSPTASRRAGFKTR